MKKLSTLIILSSLSMLYNYTQNTGIVIDSKEYEQLKLDHQLEPNTVLIRNEAMNAAKKLEVKIEERSGGGNCNCLQTIDSTFSLAMPPTDDFSSSAIVLPFNFCFYGQNVDTFFINNNGNISLHLPYATFSAVSFPTSSFEMIAPFWGDADTRADSLGIHGHVYYKTTPTAMIVVWDSVGYFSKHGDKRNTFQLIITDGTDSLIPGGANITFCYGDMQWTTGDASMGVNGFGGVPATVGVNRGNAVDYFQIGRFNLADTTYDGSYGNNDGIDFLDNKEVIINTCLANVPPIALGDECDTMQLFVGQSIDVRAYFLAPEIGQNTSVTVSAPTGFTLLDTTFGSTSIIHYQFTGSPSNVGFNTVSFTATDNGSPTQTSHLTQVIEVIDNAGIAEAELHHTSIFPNPSYGHYQVQLNDPAMGQVQLTVYSCDGQVVYQKLVEKNTTELSVQLDLDGLTAGLYIAKVTVGNKVSNFKLIKQAP